MISNRFDKCELDRTSLTITYRCNLKCRLCSMHVPYYEVPPHFTYEILAKSIDRYFEIVTSVGMFTISGGEPLSHKELPQILLHLLQYSNQIGSIEIVTNGTFVPGQELVDVLIKNREKIVFLVDNYGEISTHVNEIKELFEGLNINHRIRKYYGEDAHCGGWVDFGDFTQKWFSQEEVEKIYNKCALPKKLHCFQITGGEMYSCSRSRRCAELNIIPKDENEFLGLFDVNTTVEQQRKKIHDLLNKKSLLGCAYCNGMCEDSPRFTPAEQL